MHCVLIATFLLLAMPITGSGWVEGSNVLLDPSRVCKKTRRIRGKLLNICKNETSLLAEITHGINTGFKECEYQFRNRRFNCTLLKKNNSMKKILTKDTRESAFVNAITSAGITFAITQACSKGNLVECSCVKNHAKRHQYLSGPPDKIQNSKKIKRKSNKNSKKKKLEIIPPNGSWEWGGCDDNVNFGYRLSKIFLDARYKKRSDIKTLVKLHNNDAGRLSVRNHMRFECKCHGVSATCTMKTCFLKMSSFREIGDRLKEHFDGASKVIARNDGNSFMAEGATIKPPTPEDLIYTDESPDFCEANHKTGSLGTHGRHCNTTSQGDDGCDLLCCSRGYNHRTFIAKVNCKCMFKWCCNVTCETCNEKREENTCR